jgi:hypothetical protein
LGGTGLITQLPIRPQTLKAMIDAGVVQRASPASRGP